MTKPIPTHHVFSYGTLQEKAVQIANFGRQLRGHADALPGHVLRVGPRHANAEPSPNPEDAVIGMVFELTAQELALADAYEAADRYRRIAVTLRSGIAAWVYVEA